MISNTFLLFSYCDNCSFLVCWLLPILLLSALAYAFGYSGKGRMRDEIDDLVLQKQKLQRKNKELEDSKRVNKGLLEDCERKVTEMSNSILSIKEKNELLKKEINAKKEREESQ